jgi:hypothetical protein
LKRKFDATPTSAVSEPEELMFDYLEYTSVDGCSSPRRRGLRALDLDSASARSRSEGQGIAHRFVTLPGAVETKNKAKAALARSFKSTFLPLRRGGGEKTLIGFIEEDWRKTPWT